MVIKNGWKKEIFFLAEAINFGKHLIFIANHYREINFIEASLPYAHNGFYLVEQIIKCVDYRNLILKIETQAKAHIVSLILDWIQPSRWRWFGILIKSQNIKNARNYEFSKKTQIATDNASVELPSESVRKMNNSGVFLTCFIINRIKLNKWSLIGFIFLAITIHFSHFEMEWLCHHADCIHYLVFVPLYSFPSHSQLLLMLSWYSFSRSELNLWWWKL